MKFLVSYRFLNANLDERVSRLSLFPTLDENEKDDDLFIKSAYPFEKLKSFESFGKKLNLKTKHFGLTLKESIPCDKEQWRLKTIFEGYNFTNGKELTKLYLKNDVLL